MKTFNEKMTDDQKIKELNEVGFFSMADVWADFSRKELIDEGINIDEIERLLPEHAIDEDREFTEEEIEEAINFDFDSKVGIID